MPDGTFAISGNRFQQTREQIANSSNTFAWRTKDRFVSILRFFLTKHDDGRMDSGVAGVVDNLSRL